MSLKGVGKRSFNLSAPPAPHDLLDLSLSFTFLGHTARINVFSPVSRQLSSLCHFLSIASPANCSSDSCDLLSPYLSVPCCVAVVLTSTISLYLLY